MVKEADERGFVLCAINGGPWEPMEQSGRTPLEVAFDVLRQRDKVFPSLAPGT